MNNVIIAIDGYSSCGKSTVAKAIAKELGYIYIDSGAMYRAVTLYFVNQNIKIDDVAAVKDALVNIKIEFRTIDDNLKTYLNDIDVTEEIRHVEISRLVAKISSLKAVRRTLVKLQQKIGANQNIVMDGRDIGTTVFPNAQVKLFMTADPKIRAQRRYKELLNKNHIISLEEVFKDLIQRDSEDMKRSESPLIQSADAIVIDNTTLGEKEQVDYIISQIRGKLNR